MASDDVSGSALITFLSGASRGRSVMVEASGAAIGRDDANDIVVRDDPKVSRRHARLLRDAAGWRIENVSRGNFIRVNGVRAQQASLADGTVIYLGDDTSFVFHLAPVDASDAPEHHDRVTPPRALERDEPGRAPQPVVAVRKSSRPTAPSTTAPSPAEQAHVDATQVASPSLIGLPRLEITSNMNGARQTYLLSSPVIDVGRDATNDIVIDERIVSGKHLRIVRQGSSFMLIHPHPDRQQTLNGLRYQGRKIQGDEAFTKTLAPGDFFRIGNDDGAFVTLTYADGLDGAQPQAPALESVALGAAELTLGRSPDNTIVLAHPQVSAHHARLTRDGATYRIIDLQSTNHVYVNGDIVDERTLKTGDEIRIGPYRLIYEGTQLKQYDESSFIRIDARRLKKLGANNITLLDDISLSIPPRSFVALVGGSGAGKSTLLDALNGLRPAQQGSVLYNGENYYTHLAAYSAQMGYVPQDDIVHRDLTVERALYYAARLRLPSDFTDEQIEQRISETLDDVELTHRRGLLVRSLSGGQRKRVSIAMELLANPSVFFLDEPTSGLDPGLDRKMMLLLRNLADRGHTIVLVTHATNNINSCDYVCFLCSGGRLAYFGPPEQAKAYFDRTDFAEIYSSLEPTEENPAIPADAEARFRASPEYQRYVAEPLARHSAGTQVTAPIATQPPAATSATSAAGATGATAGGRSLMHSVRRSWSQFMLLSRRYLELLRNDSVNLAILLLQAPIIALLLVVMLRFEVGAGIFNANTLTQCRTQIITASGALALPQAQHVELVDCQQALTFLQQSPAGRAYAQQRGGARQALQDFIVPGPGADAQKALFIMAFATILFGCINGVREFVKESAIYRRERAVNVGIAPYMFSKIVVLGLLSLLQSAVLVLVVQIGEPLRQGIIFAPAIEAYITLSLTAIAGLMIGLAISAIAPNADRAVSFVPIILLPQVIFSGAIIPLKDWLTQILAAIFPSRWAMAALGSTVGLHAETVGGDRLFGNDYTYHGTLFSIYSQTDALHRLLLSWAALAALIVALTFVIAVFLKRKDHAA